MLELQLTKNLFKHGICSSIEVTNSDSILQHKAIQLSNLKQFNCSIEEKNIIQYGNTKSTLHQIRETKLPSVKTTSPVISNAIAEEEACLSVNNTAAAYKNDPTIRQ